MPPRSVEGEFVHGGEGNVKCSAAAPQRTKPASDIPSVCPWCLSRAGRAVCSLSTAVPYQLPNKGIKKLVVVAKYRHHPIKILNAFSEEPSTDLIKSLW